MGGTDSAHPLLLAPSNFFTFRHPWYDFCFRNDFTTLYVLLRNGRKYVLCLIPPLRRKVVWIFPNRVAKPRVGKKNFPMSHEWRSHEWQIGKFTIPHFSSVVVCHNYTVSVNLTLIKLNLNISTVGVISITPTVDISTVGVISITPTVDTSLL